MLPPELAPVMIPFRSIFSKSVYRRALVLVVGALLAVRARTVTAALRVMGRDHAPDFGTYHRVLNRAVWSPREAARLLLLQLAGRFMPEGPLVFGIDDTIERRWGPKIKARAIYRDPVRSSRGHFVKASGLRWLSVMLLTPIPWAARVWALPFLTTLCPSEHHNNTCRGHHKKLSDWARQMILQIRRWLPARKLVVVGDNSFSVIDLLAATQRHSAAMVTRLRLTRRNFCACALYEPAPPRPSGTLGRPRKKGERLPKLEERLIDPRTEWQPVKATWWYGLADKEVEIATGTAVWYHSGKPVVPLRWVLVRDADGDLEPKAFLSTDQEASPTDIVRWFVRRWYAQKFLRMEVTFEEMRRHLGMETQRQWSDLAILRTTPCLLGLFSVVALMADRLASTGALEVQRSAWYEKPKPTFSDALAVVRVVLWKQQQKHYCRSGPRSATLKIPTDLLERLIRTLSYTA